MTVDGWLASTGFNVPRLKVTWESKLRFRFGIDVSGLPFSLLMDIRDDDAADGGCTCGSSYAIA